MQARWANRALAYESPKFGDDDPFYVLADLVEDRYYGSPIYYDRLRKDYVNRGVVLHLALDLNVAQGARRVCIDLEREHERDIVSRLKSQTRTRPTGPAGDHDCLPDDVQESVLVDSVQFVEHPKDVGLRIGSRAWLKLLNRCLSFRPKVADLHSTAVVELVLLPKDRELGSFVGLGSSLKRELPDEVIQGRAQVVEHVPDHNGPVGRFLVDGIPLDHVLAPLTIKLARDTVSLSVDEVPKLAMELRQVMLCAPELQVNTIQWVAHGVTSV